MSFQCSLVDSLCRSATHRLITSSIILTWLMRLYPPV
nr:MAG TPA: hypothetical protein [Caudoviricetes sp.]